MVLGLLAIAAVVSHLFRKSAIILMSSALFTLCVGGYVAYQFTDYILLSFLILIFVGHACAYWVEHIRGDMLTVKFSNSGYEVHYLNKTIAANTLTQADFTIRRVSDSEYNEYIHHVIFLPLEVGKHSFAGNIMKISTPKYWPTVDTEIILRDLFKILGVTFEPDQLTYI